jgi:hypothetical protein
LRRNDDGGGIANEFTEAADELPARAHRDRPRPVHHTLIVNSLSRLLIWSMQPHRQAARATAVVAKAAA